jgi:hypothetical protein
VDVSIEPDIASEPPVVSVSVTGTPAAVPSDHVVAVDIVIVLSIVHVSPGVAKVVGDAVPFVQLVNTFTAPAVLVVHAVAYPFRAKQHNNTTSKKEFFSPAQALILAPLNVVSLFMCCILGMKKERLSQM